MCEVLCISRQTYYYKPKEQLPVAELEEEIEEIFFQSRKNYGTRKIKKELIKRGFQVSRRKIGQIMKKRHLVSNYTKAHFKVKRSSSNESKDQNLLDRRFKDREPLEVIVTDLTYVRVGQSWHYICFILDLFNREIIGYSCGKNKDAMLVKRAFSRIPYSLNNVDVFHTDRGKEFDNRLIDSLLETFSIQRSLSEKGSPHDNAVAESTYKSTKIEFVYPNKFDTLEQLEIQLFDYVHWWNHLRLHGSLGYETPIAYRLARLAKRTLDNERECDIALADVA